MKTKTKITHNKPSQRTLLGKTELCPSSQTVDVPDGSPRVFVELPGDGHAYVYSEPREPEPIPMREMKPGEWAVVVSPLEFEGRRCYRDSYDSDVLDMDEPSQAWRSDGDTIKTCTVHVILRQPGESLTIEVVEEPEEPTPTTCGECQGLVESGERHKCTDAVKGAFRLPEDAACYAWKPIVTPDPDDQLERLAGGVTRKACDNCGDGPKHGRDNCNRDGGSQLESDIRGECACAHPCWRPIEPPKAEPQTLETALRTGTAEEIAGAMGAEALGGMPLVVDALGDAAEMITQAVYDREGFTADECDLEAARIFVALRDRLDLFGEESNAAN